MNAGKWMAAALLGGVLLAGCAGVRLEGRLELMEPGSITIDKVRAIEKPIAEWKNDDGSVTLEYDARAQTDQNLMMDFDSKGVLVAARQVLTPENLEKIHTGMRRAEIKRILGNPHYTWKDGFGSEVWEWPLDAQSNDGSAKYQIEVRFHPTADGAVSVKRDSRFR